MSLYKIKCSSVGENILAQKILLEKGYTWTGGHQRPMFTNKGQNLFIRARTRKITKSGLASNHFEEESKYTQISLSGLMKL